MHLPRITGEASQGSTRGGANVLVADSEPCSRLALSLILRRAGYRVTTAESTLEAVVGACALAPPEDRFDLLVLDPQGVGPTRDELMQALDRLGVQLPVLCLDGGWEPAGRQAQPQAAWHIEKPFTPEDLLRRIATVLVSPRHPSGPGPRRGEPS